MASRLTPLALVALGLLRERPMHAYEMYMTLMNRQVERMVKIRPGSLYHTVDRLVADGFATPTGCARDGNRPERTTYAITEAGSAAIRDRVTEMLGTRAEEYPEFVVALSEAHNLPRATVLERLEPRLAELRATLAELEDGAAELESRPLERRYWIEVSYSLAMARADVAWLETFLADLASGDLPW